MQNTSVESTPHPTAELAIAAVNGMIGQVGQGKDVKILNIDVREVEGGYIAVATLQIVDPEVPQEKPENEKRPEDEKILGNSAEQKDNAVDLYYLQSHTSEAQSAIPDAEQNIAPEQESGGPAVPFVNDKDNESAPADILASNSVVTTVPDATIPGSENLSEMIQTDFVAADAAEAYNVDPQEIAAERLAEKPLSDMSSRELEELQAAVERRLKDLPPEAIPPDAGDAAPASPNG